MERRNAGVRVLGDSCRSTAVMLVLLTFVCRQGATAGATPPLRSSPRRTDGSDRVAAVQAGPADPTQAAPAAATKWRWGFCLSGGGQPSPSAGVAAGAGAGGVDGAGQGPRRACCGAGVGAGARPPTSVPANEPGRNARQWGSPGAGHDGVVDHRRGRLPGTACHACGRLVHHSARWNERDSDGCGGAHTSAIRLELPTVRTQRPGVTRHVPGWSVAP